MRFKKVLLIIPKFPGKNQGKSVLILGMGYISQYLKDHGIENKVVDMQHGYSIKALKKIIAEYQPDLIGIQIMTYRHDLPYSLIRKIKSDQYKIVVGGHHVSTIDKEILKEIPADFAIRVEGEDAILELCQGKPFNEIKNLIYKEEGNIFQNELRPFIKDLDKINFPKYESFELDQYDEQIPITTSRGCPFQCIYCPCAATIGREFRVRSPENVIEELKYWYNRGHKRFAFVDDNFTLLPDRVVKICELIKKEKLSGLDIYCQGIRADKLTLPLLKTMREAGFSQLGIGVEVGNDKMLKVIKKYETKAQIEQAIQWAIEAKFDVQLYCMIGLPYETTQDVEDTFRLATKFPIADVHFYNVIPFPKTELWDWVSKNKYFIDDPKKTLIFQENLSKKPLFQTPELPMNERTRLLKKSDKIEKQVLRKYFIRKMRPTFKFLTVPLTYIIFIEPIRQSINFTFQTKIGKKVIRTLLNILKLELHYL